MKMDSVLKRIWTVACFIGMFLSDGSDAVVFTPCVIPTQAQGNWEVLDVTRTSVETTVTITAKGLTGITFWNKTLNYTCYVQQGDYYVFVSDTTDLFDIYDVNIYFCWYLLSYSSDKYRLYELTDKVLYTIEQRAKAYLNTTIPTVNDVCEVAFDTSLAYKQMQLIVQKSGASIVTISAQNGLFFFSLYMCINHLRSFVS